jgi:hypothetical protein
MNTVTVRLEDGLLERIDEREGSSRQEKIVALIGHALDAPPGLKPLMLSRSQIASLDQTAERWGVTRLEAIERILTERIRRELTEERQRQLNDHVKRKQPA